jgi:hypothetical protein
MNGHQESGRILAERLELDTDNPDIEFSFNGKLGALLDAAQRLAFKGTQATHMPKTGENTERGTVIFGGTTDAATTPDGAPYHASLEFPAYLWQVLDRPEEIEVFFRVRKPA